MNINLELYRAFYYVAVTLSFSEASRQLYISQSAVSQSVKTLEKKLGRQLFIRSTKKVTLTPDGELLLSHIEPAIRMITEGEALLTHEDSIQGQLRIGSSDTICRYFLLDYLKQFHQDYPDVQIQVTNSTSIGCAKLLDNGQVDFIISNFPNSYLNASHPRIPLREFQDVFTAHPSCFPLDSRTLSLKELLDYPILTLTKHSVTSEYLYEHFQNHGLKLVPEVELSSNDLLVDMAQIGLGIAFVPDYMLKKNTELISLSIQEPLPPRKLVLVHPKTGHMTPVAEKFMEYF